MANPSLNAEVLAVFPDKIKILVKNIDEFKDKTKLSVGSYLRISDSDDSAIIAVIENYSISIDEDDSKESRDKKYILEALPLGFLTSEGTFVRGSNEIAIPPKSTEPAKEEEIRAIYNSVPVESKFCFSKLSLNTKINVPVDGDRFFSKHFAIVGSTGSGKSHTLARLIQSAIQEKNSGYEGLNNSHIIIFDIHSEYKTAFPTANIVDINSIKLPYWLFNSEELEELFLDTDANDYNQRNIFKEAVVKYKKDEEDRKGNTGKVHYDSPVYFDINDVLKHIQDKNIEMISGANGKPKQGSMFGKLTNFISRLENKLSDKRLDFLLGEKAKKLTFEEVLKSNIGYSDKSESNVSIIDLSGVPFEVLSITVSLLTRMLFEYGYYFKKNNPEIKTPLLLVYEEAHKYIPKSDLSKYRASRESIERVAKEGRKYGVTLAIVSQRPSEVSETIFSQCNNFIAMRLTNPEDQNYVRRLLPDTLGNLTDSLPTLQAGEALVIGDSVPIPSIVNIDPCDKEKHPSSNDINYLQEWKAPWFSGIEFDKLITSWRA